MYLKLKNKIKAPFKEISTKIDTLYRTQGNLERKINLLLADNDLTKISLDSAYDWIDEHSSKICHAMGAIEGNVYTNSLEAFEEHYRNGYRCFECDINVTKDFIPVVVHDWSQYNGGNLICWEDIDLNTPYNVPTYDEFKNTRILEKYTALSLYDLVLLAKKYRSARFIVSLKTRNYEYSIEAEYILSALSYMINEVDEELYERLIPQVHNISYATNVIFKYKFKYLVYGIREYSHDNYTVRYLKELAGDLERIGIKICAGRLKYLTKEICDIFHEKNIKVAAFGVKNLEDEKRAINNGVDLCIADYELK